MFPAQTTVETTGSVEPVRITGEEEITLARLKNTALNPGTPSGKIVAYLQRHGSASVRELEDALGVTTNAVRQQLTQLQTNGWIFAKLCRRGVGRPYHRYYLTDEAKRVLSSGASELLVSLYRQIASDPSSEISQRLSSILESEMVRWYREAMEPGGSPEERLRALARRMVADGLQAEVTQEGDTLSLRVYACPYYSLAREGEVICQMSKKAMSLVLGVPVEKTRCTVEEHTFCCFRVRTGERETEATGP